MVVAIKTLDSIVISRRPIKKKKQNLCLDRGYYSAAEIEREVVKRKYMPHIRRRGEKKKKHREKKRKDDGSWNVQILDIIGSGNC